MAARHRVRHAGPGIFHRWNPAGVGSLFRIPRHGDKNSQSTTRQIHAVNEAQELAVPGGNNTSVRGCSRPVDSLPTFVQPESVRERSSEERIPLGLMAVLRALTAIPAGAATFRGTPSL